MNRTLFVIVGAVALLVAGVLFLALRPKADTSADPVAGARFVVGKPEAKVTVVEFFNYMCPYCEQFAGEQLPLLMKDYVETGKVRYVFRDLQFGEGNTPTAVPVRAAEAAACAADGGKFLEYHEALYRSKAQWETLSGDPLDGFLGDLGRQLGAEVSSCLASGSKKAGVEADIALAGRLQVNSTPTFLVNGKTEERFSRDWRSILDEAVAKAGSGETN